MKKRIRQALCIVSALVLMCVSFVLPASADTTYPALTTSNVSDVLLANYKNILNKHWGTSDLACIVAWAQNSDNSIAYRIEVFDKKYIGTTVSYNGLYYGHIGDNGCETTEDIVNGYWNNRNLNFNNPFYSSSLYKSLTGQSSIQFHIVYSNIKIDGVTDIVDPDAPVVPFSVQYSRKLTTGMSRSGTLSDPGAKNDGETITNNNIDVTVKLTDEYKQAMQKALDKDPKATQYTYQYVLFITPYNPNIYGTKKAMDGAIYTFLDKSKYVLTTAYGKTKSNTTTDSKYDTVSTPDSSSADTSSGNVGEMTSENADGVANTAFCNGVTPLFGLPIANGANMTNTHTINLENIKGADKLGEQDILYIVVVGKRYLYETGAEGYAKDFYANNAEFKTFYKELPDNAVASKINGLYGGNGYDFYTVVSDGFSFKDYPDYKPLEINGVEYPTDKSISDMLDDPFPPSKFTDYDGLENGTDFDTKEDFDEYIRNKTYDEEFGSFSFNLSDISSIFDSTSDFFKFMTASIGLMPSIFITVLIAFFTIMLGICIVKWAIK